MRTLFITTGLSMLLVLVLGRAAAAQEVSTEHGMGVGATRTLTGVNAGTFVYDVGKWDVMGLLGFATVDIDPGQDYNVYALGGQFHYHIHSTARSDFSVGGGLTIVQDNADHSNVDLEALASIRVFLVDNVALSANLGLLIAIGDDDGLIFGEPIGAGAQNGDSLIAIGGQPAGSFGITYFFKP